MGSEEGFTMADKAIQQASRQGTWVLLKNVHLSCKWLNELEKKMYKMVPNEKFRIFLTMEFNPKVPKNLLRLAYTFVFEPPAGIKASVLRSFSSIMTTKRSEQNPMAVRCRMHFLLAFLHAVVLERKRYVPVGWSKGYEFSDADQQAAIDIIDQWIDQTEVSPGGAKGRDVQHLDPARIPWEAIRTLLQDVAYGGRLDNEVDKRVLFSIIESIFTPNSFDSDFELSLSYKSLNLPDLEDDAPQLLAPDLGRGRDHYIGWVESALPLIDKPTWLGFAPHAELLLSQRAGSHALTGWGTLHGKSSEDLHDLLKGAGVEIKRSASLAAPSGGRQAGGGPKKVTSWIDELLVVVETLLKLVTVSFQPLPRTEKAVQDPLFRCFDREVSTGSTFVMRMKADLELLKLVCAGEEKFTNYTRDVAKVIFRGGVPKSWKGYVSMESLSVAEWTADFITRLQQLSAVSKEFGGNGLVPIQGSVVPPSKLPAIMAGHAPSTRTVWFGGLSFPSAYLTATQQAVAQRFSWSLDDLCLNVEIGSTKVGMYVYMYTCMYVCMYVYMYVCLLYVYMYVCLFVYVCRETLLFPVGGALMIAR
eukprot:GHVU01089441.1.p1 GENE.GHVU01089441.1~~GHVU01089441.1.p1  ORF type:complete len:587 (+),score=144.66 GHVU01089441.1:818-2578(+)